MSYFTRIEPRGRPTFVGLTARLLLRTVLCFAGLLACPAQQPASAGPGGAVQAIRSMRDPSHATANPASAANHPAPRKQQYSLTVTAEQWLDTGLTVNSGESIGFEAAGSLSLADGRTATPLGLDRGWKDLLRQFPLNQANTGALIGRVSDLGASVPFLVGAKNAVVMPTSGRLYLRANLSDDLASTGDFQVTLRPISTTPGKIAAAGPASEAPPADLTGLLSPETFAQIPRRVADEVGAPGDMVNFALIGSEAQVKSAFKNAGWVAVDKTTQDAVLHGLLATLNHEAYLEMPMSTLYLFSRPQDLSFARADPLTVAAERHHLRVWKTTETIAGEPLWVGSATHDIGFERDQRNGRTTHKIDPKIDDERTFLLDSFDAAGDFTSAAYVTPTNPLTEAKTATGGSFYSDGRIAVMRLKPGLP